MDSLILHITILKRRSRRRITRHIDTRLAIRLTSLLVHAYHIPLIGSEVRRLILFIQMLLQQSQILGIGFKRRVRQISNKRHQTHEEIDRDVDHHPDNQGVVNPSIEFAGLSDEEEGESGANGISKSRDNADDGFPAEAHAEEGEEGAVEVVGAFAEGGEDHGVLFGNVGGDLLLDFFELAWFAWVFDHGEVGILWIDRRVSMGKVVEEMGMDGGMDLLLTSPPVGFLLSYFFICFLSSLFAAYLPTAPAMMAGYRLMGAIVG